MVNCRIWVSDRHLDFSKHRKSQGSQPGIDSSMFWYQKMIFQNRQWGGIESIKSTLLANFLTSLSKGQVLRCQGTTGIETRTAIMLQTQQASALLIMTHIRDRFLYQKFCFCYNLRPFSNNLRHFPKTIFGISQSFAAWSLHFTLPYYKQENPSSFLLFSFSLSVCVGLFSSP